MTFERGGGDREFVRTMYQAKVQQFLSDNARIWTTGAFLIPLSLTPFAGVIERSLSFWELLILAGGSFLLISSWIAIAEAHRNFQNASQNWMDEIERLHEVGPQEVERRGGLEKASETGFVSSLMDRSGAVRRFRYILWFAIVGAWVVLLATTPDFGP